MKTEALLTDPVFQLNLLLWMAKEQPSVDCRVRPLFFERGFKIIYIENPFPFPEETARAMRDLGLDISEAPEPELILGRERDSRALYFEAKANSFGIASPNSRQARAHLIATGPVFGEVLSPLKACLLCYVVPDGARKRMSECLIALSDELQSKGLKPGPFSCHGLAVSGTKIVYSWDSIFKDHVGATEDAVPIIDDVAEDTDPAPLLLVFSDEDCCNIEMRDFYRRVVIDQVRAWLLSDLHSHALGEKYETSPDNLLTKTTDGVFQYLGRERQKGLRKLVRENIFKKIADYWKDKQSGVTLVGNQLVVTWSVIGEKDDFLNWLEDRRMRFDASTPPVDLFDRLDADRKGV
ncbi:MAG: hypothetical protein Q8Q12_19525 [bacterium]|nr:hypothetical protein [bacterium]